MHVILKIHNIVWFCSITLLNLYILGKLFIENIMYTCVIIFIKKIHNNQILFVSLVKLCMYLHGHVNLAQDYKTTLNRNQSLNTSTCQV